MVAIFRLEEIINYRLKGTAIGFNSKLDLEPKNYWSILKKLENQDLLKFEWYQNLLKTCSNYNFKWIKRRYANSNNDPAKNAIVKQFESLMKMDGVKLEVKDDALKEIAKLAVSQNIEPED